MNKIITIMMYFLWILTVVFVLATTFTNFQYEDINAIAIVSFVFAVINSILVVTTRKK